jgi:hypothetical protein
LEISVKLPSYDEHWKIGRENLQIVIIVMSSLQLRSMHNSIFCQEFKKSELKRLCKININIKAFGNKYKVNFLKNQLNKLRL